MATKRLAIAVPPSLRYWVLYPVATVLPLVGLAAWYPWLSIVVLVFLAVPTLFLAGTIGAASPSSESRVANRPTKPALQDPITELRVPVRPGRVSHYCLATALLAIAAIFWIHGYLV